MKPPIQPLREGDPKSFQGWTLKGFIAEGGQSTIYLAEKDGKRAALKMIRKEYLANQKSVDRFFTEIRNLELLDHPNISRVIDVEDSGKFLAIEFIDGPNLEDYVKESGPIGTQQWWDLAQTLATAVDYCHSKGIIHKDISPRNIIIGPNGPVLVDFGISYLEKDQRLTTDGEEVGTPPFMSPEHFGITTPKQMDVFCLGGTLLFAATGHHPFSGTNRSELRESILFYAPDFGGLSNEIATVLSPLLYKRPEERSSLSSFSKLISEVCSNEFQSNFVAQEFTKIKRESHKKLVREKKNLEVKTRFPFNKKRALSKRSIAIGLTVTLSAILLLGSYYSIPSKVSKLFNTETTKLANECRSYLKNGNLDQAVQSCFSATDAGDTASASYLARAYLAKKTDAQAESVLNACKATETACLSDHAFFFQNGEEAMKSLKLAHSKGDADAAWRIGSLYAKKNEMTSALKWYETGSKSGSAGADISLALYWGGDSIKDYEKALTYAKKAVGGDLSGRPELLLIDNVPERLIESIYTQDKNVKGKISYFTECANKKSAFCIETLSYAYLREEDFTNAKKWGLQGADINNAKSMWVLSQVEKQRNASLPKGTSDPSIDAAIVNWYKKAAELGDVKSAVSLGFSYALGFGGLESNLQQSCVWFQKGMTYISERKGSWKEEVGDAKDYERAAQFFELQNCQIRLLGDAPLIGRSTASPIPSKAKTAAPSSTPKSTPKPIASSDSFKESAPLASNTEVGEIFGRAFKNGLNYWVIPLTTTKGAKVPEITAIQFRMIGYPNAGWMDVPYKLKTDATFGTVHAEVDDFLFAVIFKDAKYCPEFRVAREEGGKIVQIWNKGQPECATDYNP